MTKKLDLKDMTDDNAKYQPFINQHEPVSDEISLRAIEELFDTENKLPTISRIKFEQVKVLSKLSLFNDTFEDNFTNKLYERILNLQISISGLGRKEIVQLVQQRSMFGEVDNKKSSKDIFR